MAQNNLNHYSDLAKYKIFDPTNTQWPSTVKNVQDALAGIGSWALISKGLPQATESTLGVAKVATQAQVDAGTDDTTFVTPKKLKVRLSNPAASTTVLGLTYYATNAEASAFSLNTKAIVPSALGYVFNNVTATSSRLGTIKLATSAMGQAGTDNTTATTPSVVVEMIAKYSPVAPSYSTANETTLGLTYLATTGQTAQGTLRDGYAVSPYAFINTRASESQAGTIKIASQNDVNNGNGNDTAVSPRAFMASKASRSKYGIVRMSSAYDANEDVALLASAPVVYNTLKINGHALTGDFNITSDDIWVWNRQQSDDRYAYKSDVGNWSRTWAGAYNDINNEWNVQTNLPVNGSGSIAITAKFNTNDRNAANRYFNFEIWVNGNRAWSDSMNVWNSKVGKGNGHEYLYEAFATRYFQFDVPAGATVRVVPTGNNFGAWYGTMLTVNS